MGIMDIFRKNAQQSTNDLHAELTLATEKTDTLNFELKQAGSYEVQKVKDKKIFMKESRRFIDSIGSMALVTSFADPTKAPIYGLYILDEKTNDVRYYKVQCNGEKYLNKDIETFYLSYLKDGVACTAKVKCPGQSSEFEALTHGDIVAEDPNADTSKLYPHAGDLTRIFEAFKNEKLIEIADANIASMQDDHTM